MHEQESFRITKIIFSLLLTAALLWVTSPAVAQEEAETVEPASEEPIPEDPAPADPFTPERTLDECRDETDNDGDGHVDCDDQDCEIYVICLKQGETEEPPVAEPEKEGEGEIIHRPFSVAFAPGVSTDMRVSGETLNNFSLNFIGWGYHLHGAEFSAIGSIRRRDVVGFQGGGVFNYTHGKFKGFQGAGVGNVALGSLKGFQAAGVASYAHGNLTGLQGAGVISVAANDLKGIQGSGVSNAVIGDMRGFQGAGVANYAGSIRGVQASGTVNIAAKDMSGLQIGLFNYATRAKGAQIGLVNIATKEMKGAPIGLVSYAGDGIFAPTLWWSDTSTVNLAMKMGSRHVYGILGYGIHPVGDNHRDSVISGIGGHIEFDPMWLEIDVVSHFMHDEFDWSQEKNDSVHKLRATVGLRLLDQMSIFVGPTLNMLVSDADIRTDDVALIPTLADYSNDDYTLKMSLGFIGGIQWEPQFGDLNSR